MAKEPQNPTPEATVTATVATPEVVAELVYCGPAYHKGMELPNSRDMIRPGDWNQDEIKAWLELNPTYNHWFTPKTA